MQIELRPVDLFALRSLALDRLRDCARQESDATCQWYDVITDQTVTITELIAVLTSVRVESQPMQNTYRISADGRSITCRGCGFTSYHPEDVRQLYCGNCHRFHERYQAADQPPPAQT